MPLLKYRCENCDHVFEELVLGSKQPSCPKCGSDDIKRHYQGKCYFGGSSDKGGGCAKGSCCGCKGCSG